MIIPTVINVCSRVFPTAPLINIRPALSNNCNFLSNNAASIILHEERKTPRHVCYFKCKPTSSAPLQSIYSLKEPNGRSCWLYGQLNVIKFWNNLRENAACIIQNIHNKLNSGKREQDHLSHFKIRLKRIHHSRGQGKTRAELPISGFIPDGRLVKHSPSLVVGALTLPS